MSENVLIEGNKMIADFMGLYRKETNERLEHFIYPKGKEKYSFTDHTLNALDLEYHSSWEWLMDVVEKIEDIDARGIYAVTIGWGQSCRITFEDETTHPMIYINSTTANSKIEVTWQAVVEFIKFYNQSKTTKSIN